MIGSNIFVFIQHSQSFFFTKTIVITQLGDYMKPHAYLARFRQIYAGILQSCGDIPGIN